MARARIEPPEPGWAARRVLAVRLERLGYHVEELGAGDAWVLLVS